MTLRTRFALAFAAIGAVVALLVGALSYRAASDRVVAEIDRTLRSATVALAHAEERGGQPLVSEVIAQVPELYPGPDRPGPGDEPERRMVLQTVAVDGTVTRLGGPGVPLPVSDTGRTLAASGRAGDTDIAEVVVAGRTYRRLTTALGGNRGALQVAVRIDETRRVLGGMAREIAGSASWPCWSRPARVCCSRDASPGAWYGWPRPPKRSAPTAVPCPDTWT